MPKLLVDLLLESPLFEPTIPTLLEPLPGPLLTSRLTELNLSRMSNLFLDPLRELVPSTMTERLFLDPLPELDPSTRTENDLSPGSETLLVPVSVLVVEQLLLVRLSLTTDKGLFNNKSSDPEASLFTMTRKIDLPTGLSLSTGLNLLSVTDPSLTS